MNYGFIPFTAGCTSFLDRQERNNRQKYPEVPDLQSWSPWTHSGLRSKVKDVQWQIIKRDYEPELPFFPSIKSMGHQKICWLMPILAWKICAVLVEAQRPNLRLKKKVKRDATLSWRMVQRGQKGMVGWQSFGIPMIFFAWLYYAIRRSFFQGISRFRPFNSEIKWATFTQMIQHPHQSVDTLCRRPNTSHVCKESLESECSHPSGG